MFFDDKCNKYFERLQYLLDEAEKLIAGANQKQARNTLKQVPELLELLYREINKNNNQWDVTTTSRIKGDFFNKLESFKYLQQQIEETFPSPKHSRSR